MKDLTGKRFGRLVVTSFAGIVPIGRSQKYTWNCQCDCGNCKVVKYQSLSNGETKSCGCFHRDTMAKMLTTHGHTKRGEIKHELYNTWVNMRYRCFNKKSKYYPHYGGRGIKVCERWENSFQNFLDDMGERPTKKHSIDRIDNNGDYEPINCRWATDSDQSRNKRTNIWIEHEGEKHIIADWAFKLNLSPQSLRVRLGYNTLSEIIYKLSKK